MKQTKIIMGMPITLEVIDNITKVQFDSIFDYFKKVDERFSTYKPNSEISQVNAGLARNKWSPEVKQVLELCEETKKLTNGYFDIEHNGVLDPSGLVKGWAINNAADLLLKNGAQNFYIEAGGDIQAHGLNADNQPWIVGIRNPFDIQEIIKVVQLTNHAIATSGTYIRGQHIYDPHHPKRKINSVKSLTVIGPNIYDADRYATAAFAMGLSGITFIEATASLEGYMVDADSIATYTSGFERYVV